MSKRILYIVALTALLVPMTNTIYTPNIPVVQQDLNTTTQLIALTISVYTAMMALSQLVYGPVSDRYGRRSVLFFGLSVYVLSDIAIYFSRDIYQLIALRAVQAFGVSATIVVGAAVLADVFKKDLSNALGTYTSVILIAPLIGPVIGGFVSSFYGWRAIFLFLAVIGAAAFALVYFLLKETLEKSHELCHPLAALKLLKDVPLFAVSFLGFASLATTYVFVTFFPIILNSYGVGVAAIGLALLPSGIALAIGSSVGGGLAQKKGAKFVLVSGTLIAITSIMAFAFFVHFNSSLYPALAAFTVSGFGSGMFWTASRIYIVARSHLKASVNGAFNFVSFAGATAAPFIGSVIFDSLGVFALFAGFALFMLAALMIVAWKA